MSDATTDSEVEVIEEEEVERNDKPLVEDEEELPPEDESEEEDEILSSQEVGSSSAKIADELSAENLDKVEEYFRLKDVSRTLRNDLKDLKIQMPETEELDKLNKKVKELRETIKNNENIRVLTEKIQGSKERMELLKELIRIELLESAQEEVKRNGRKLKIVNILREMKDEGDKKKKPDRKFFRN